MFDKIQFLQCSKNDLKELFNKELNGECVQVLLDNRKINIVVYYNNDNDFFNDTNILRLKLNRSYLNSYKKQIIINPNDVGLSSKKDNGFYVNYHIDEIKTFLKEKSNNRLTDNLNFLLNDTNDVVMFEMTKYEPIPFF